VNEGFSAQSGPLGENPQGHISATFAAGKLRGDVICLQVILNTAFILAVETRTDDVIPQGQQFLLNVVDNGNPVNGTPPDLIRNSFVGSFTAPSTSFPCGTPTLAPVPLVRGNIVVHDADMP
jgi:hypothetical protein